MFLYITNAAAASFNISWNFEQSLQRSELFTKLHYAVQNI
jgi:hypothetical protein